MRKTALKNKKAASDDIGSHSDSSNKNGNAANASGLVNENDPLAIEAVAAESARGQVGKKGKSKSKEIQKHGRAAKNKPVSSEETAADESEYEVEEVLDVKTTKGITSYLIRWKGYGAASDTWEPENTLSCPSLISKFLAAKENVNKATKKVAKRGAIAKNDFKVDIKKSKSNPRNKRVISETENEENIAETVSEFEVEKIIEVHHKRGGGREFLIRWKGFGSQEDTWEPEENLSCPELISKFMVKVTNAVQSSKREIRTAPKHTERFTLTVKQNWRRTSKRNDSKQRITYYDAE